MLCQSISVTTLLAPLMCGSIVTKETVKDKYLGDILHTGDSLESSVLASIKDREGKVKAAML